MLMARMVATVKQVSPADPPKEADSSLIQPLALVSSPQDCGLDAEFLLGFPKHSSLPGKPQESLTRHLAGGVWAHLALVFDL